MASNIVTATTETASNSQPSAEEQALLATITEDENRLYVAGLATEDEKYKHGTDQRSSSPIYDGTARLNLVITRLQEKIAANDHVAECNFVLRYIERHHATMIDFLSKSYHSIDGYAFEGFPWSSHFVKQMIHIIHAVLKVEDFPNEAEYKKAKNIKLDVLFKVLFTKEFETTHCWKAFNKHQPEFDHVKEMYAIGQILKHIDKPNA